jgi:hypothetical protein
MVCFLAGGDDVDGVGGLHQCPRKRIRQHPVILDEQYPHYFLTACLPGMLTASPSRAWAFIAGASAGRMPPTL